MEMQETVVAIDGHTLALALNTNDPFVVEYFRGVEETKRPPMALRAFIAGTQGLAAADGNATIVAMGDQVKAAADSATDHINRATASMKQAVEHLAEQYFGPNGKVFAGVEKAGAKAFDPDNAHLTKLRNDFAKAAQQAIAPALKQIATVVNINDENQPLGAMNRQLLDLAKAIAEVKTHLQNQAQIAAAVRRDPNEAGRSLEGFFETAVAKISSTHGDVIQDVRNEAGQIERCKAGDFLTTINPALTKGQTCKVVTEAKNRKDKTLMALINELDRALDNRGGDAALGILTSPTAKGGPIYHSGKKVVVFLQDFGAPDGDYRFFEELVAIGYAMARFVAIQSAGTPHVEAIDLDRLNECLAELGDAVKKFTTLKDNHTRIETAVQNARDTAEVVKQLVIDAGKKLRAIITEETEKLSGSEAA